MKFEGLNPGWVPGLITVLLISGSACQVISRSDVPVSNGSATFPASIPTKTVTSTITPSLTATQSPTPSITPSPTPTVTLTPIPEGYVVVPEVIGIPYIEARDILLESGLSLLYQDVLGVDIPQGTVLDQEPSAGVVVEDGTIVMLFRAFSALQVYAGGECIPLRIPSPTGRLLYWTELREEDEYRIEVDFDQGETSLFDYQMVSLKSFRNDTRGAMTFTPPTEGQYVIAIGPYRFPEDKVQQSGGLNAGCLWIYPPEED